METFTDTLSRSVFGYFKENILNAVVTQSVNKRYQRTSQQPADGTGLIVEDHFNSLERPKMQGFILLRAYSLACSQKELQSRCPYQKPEN